MGVTLLPGGPSPLSSKMSNSSFMVQLCWNLKRNIFICLPIIIEIKFYKSFYSYILAICMSCYLIFLALTFSKLVIYIQKKKRSDIPILKSLTSRKKPAYCFEWAVKALRLKKSIALFNVLLFRMSLKSIDIRRSIAPSNVP